jgi:hypothetical protein
LGVGVKSTIGKVALNIRVVDASSGEVLFATEGKGEEENANVSIGSIYRGDSSAYDSLMSEATKKALAAIITNIKTNNNKFKDNIILAKIAYCDDKDKTFLINVGSDKGITKNQILYVKKIIKEIIDQDTKEVLKTITENIAEIKVTNIEKKTATTICSLGKCEYIKERDLVSSTK